MPPQNPSSMDADLARSGLVASDMDATEEPPSAFAPGTPSPGYTFPYYNPDGSIHPRMKRTRLYAPGKGQGKYTQPSKAEIAAAGGEPWEATLPYLNPHVLALSGQTWASITPIKGKRILLVEGEKKSLATMRYVGRPAIGFAGAYAALWRPEASVPQPPPGASAKDLEKAEKAASRAAARAAKQPFQLHPVLKALLNPGDLVEVIFDADVMTNPDVNRAAGTLRQVLQKHGCKVRFILLPTAGGIDDWIAGLPDKSLIPSLFESLDRTDGHEFSADYQTVYEALGLVLNANDVPIPNLTNINRIIERHPDLRDRLWYDVVRNRLYETFTAGDAPRQVTDSTPIQLTIWMQTRLGLHHFTHTLVKEALYACADNEAYERNFILDQLTARWDGTPRLETMFITAFGADDTTYTRMVGSMWAIGAIARLMEPGCQMDTMLVLEGEQGIGKSKALEILGLGGYVALQQKLDNKDFLVAAHTSWIVDMVELGAMKWADMETIKGLITTRTDTFRKPYGRVSKNYQRRFVMVGTTNSDDYLRDETGNRRYWPIKCNGAVNVQWLNAWRLQLWAEALHRYNAGEQYWEDLDSPTALATRAEQNARVAEDPWGDVLGAVLSNTSGMHRVIINSKQHYFIAALDILFALGVSQAESARYTRRLRSLMRDYKEWQDYQYQSKTQTLTLKGGGAVLKVRGYILTEAAPAPTDNVTPLPQRGKF